MPASVRKVRAAELISSRVVTADGRELGKVVDLHLSAGPGYEVTELLIGPAGWLERLDIARLFSARIARSQPDRIPWSAVDRFERNRVILKPGHEGETRDHQSTPTMTGGRTPKIRS